MHFQRFPFDIQVCGLVITIMMMILDVMMMIIILGFTVIMIILGVMTMIIILGVTVMIIILADHDHHDNTWCHGDEDPGPDYVTYFHSAWTCLIWKLLLPISFKWEPAPFPLVPHSQVKKWLLLFFSLSLVMVRETSWFSWAQLFQGLNPLWKTTSTRY